MSASSSGIAETAHGDLPLSETRAQLHRWDRGQRLLAHYAAGLNAVQVMPYFPTSRDNPLDHACTAAFAELATFSVSGFGRSGKADDTPPFMLDHPGE